MFETVFLVFVGAIIGWLTNVLAIKMLFRPIKPIKLPLVNIKVQGLIPKRRNEISKSIGEIVERELISIHDILNRLITEENKKEAIGLIKEKILKAVEIKIPLLIPSAFKYKIIGYLEEQIVKEGPAILESIIDNITGRAIEHINIGKMVEEKIDDFELLKMEEIILSVAAKELKHIEILGGFLGGVIGLIQGLIIRLI